MPRRAQSGRVDDLTKNKLQREVFYKKTQSFTPTILDSRSATDARKASVMVTTWSKLTTCVSMDIKKLLSEIFGWSSATAHSARNAGQWMRLHASNLEGAKTSQIVTAATRRHHECHQS
jgi:hypothetical protein